MSARLVRCQEEAGFYLHTAYRPEFVEELKSMVPSASRRWDPIDSRWFVGDLYEAKIIQLCVVHFGGCQVYGEDGDLDLVVDRVGRTVQERLI